MKLADVYAKYNATIERADGCYIWDQQGQQILDFYSGHGVISIGHQHPRFVKRLKNQLDKLVYYSNAVNLAEQDELVNLLGELSGYQGEQLFLVNSGAEAIENALKVASFYTNRSKIIAFHRAFHGRTDLAVQCSDGDKLRAPINQGLEIEWLPLNDCDALAKAIDEKVCAVLVEGIQGVGGIHVANPEFLREARRLTEEKGAVLILDEIQSGYGRSGHFFAHQSAGIKADIVTMAKGMGNGFPVGGVIIDRKIPLSHGMLGTTFGGSPLACSAAIAVLEVLKDEELIYQAKELGAWLQQELQHLPYVKEVRGLGLMIGIDFPFPTAALRKRLFSKYQILVGSASSAETVRLLPPLTINKTQCQALLERLDQALKEEQIEKESDSC